MCYGHNHHCLPIRLILHGVVIKMEKSSNGGSGAEPYHGQSHAGTAYMQ